MFKDIGKHGRWQTSSRFAQSSVDISVLSCTLPKLEETVRTVIHTFIPFMLSVTQIMG